MFDSTLRGLASIIVPGWNQLEFTRQCIAALRRHTRDPWELIVVDNGSTDETASYLAGVRDMAAVPVTVMTNAKNVGFPAAINQGLRVARGEYLVLLNNDIVVTDGWLDQLVALANARADRVIAEGLTGDVRPAVDTGAGSGDPRSDLSQVVRCAGDPSPDGTPNVLMPLSFVTCLSSEEVYLANLLASPCLGEGSAHEALAFPECASAADGLNAGLLRARNEWIVCVHQDVYLPEGWDHCLAEQLREAERRFGPIGVAGVYGVGGTGAPADPSQPPDAEGIGWVVDRGRLLREGPGLPAQVATLDELLLVVRRDSGLHFEPALGFHLYGADICLQAHERGLAVVAVGALCHHNSRTIDLPDAFFASMRVFARKWSHRLPVATSCTVIDREWAFAV